jgi:lysophospholipase L1-like esterase
VLEKTVREQHPNVVVWLSTWELADRLDPATNQVLKLGTPAHDRALLAQMAEQAQRLTADGAHLVLLTATPRAPSDENGRPADGQDGRYAHYNALLRRFASEHRQNVSLVNTMPLVCPGGAPCPKDVRGVVLRPDGGHFTHETAPIIGRWLLPKLAVYAPPT